jgi:hypothetical protein
MSDRFKVRHRRPGCKDIRFGSAISLSLSLLNAILIWAASSILFHTVRWNVTEHYWAGLTFSLILFITSFNHAMNLLQNIVGAVNKEMHPFVLPCSLTIAAAGKRNLRSGCWVYGSEMPHYDL